MIHGMRKCQHSGQVLYLCSWEQDFLQFFYTPSWVLSQMLMINGDDSVENLRNYKLVAEFYHHFTTDMEFTREESTDEV